MNPYLLGFFVGAFFAILLITLILYAIAFKWQTSYAKSLTLNGASFAIAATISAFGMADGGPLNFKSAPVYLLAQAVVLGLDFYRIQRKFNRQRV